MGSVSFCDMTGWGTATLQAVRLIAQREIPAYAGMTWEGAGMTENLTCCGSGAIHAAKVNGTHASETCAREGGDP